MFSHHALEQVPAFTFYGEERTGNEDNKVALGDYEEENQMMHDENQENQGQKLEDNRIIVETYNRFKE